MNWFERYGIAGSYFMRKSIIFFTILVLLVCLFSCNNDDNNTTQTPTAGTIQGQVTNETGDTVLVGAIVTTLPATSSVNTNTQGNYIISNVSPGEYTVTASKGGYKNSTVNIAVIAGKTTIADIHLAIFKFNNPPNAPTLLSPQNGAINQNTSITLNWTCTDPDSDILSYDLYFGTFNPPTIIISANQTTTNFIKTGLDTSTIYYWKIIAKDNHGDSSISSIYYFTTHGDTMGIIRGKVTNSTGDTVIVGALVTTVPATSSVSTGITGDYIITNVTPGPYTVTASKVGYNSSSVNISVQAGETTIADIHLPPVSFGASKMEVSLFIGDNVVVTLANGIFPYSIKTSPNTAVAVASLVDNHIIILGVNEGSTWLVAQDSNTPTPDTVKINIQVIKLVSFSADVQPIFNQYCTSCHGTSGGLSLTAGVSYSKLVDVYSQSSCLGMKRVVPYDALNSVLYKKIVDTLCGPRMPKNGAILPVSKRYIIEQWINQAALDN
jgi:hypothetical protein